MLHEKIEQLILCSILKHHEGGHQNKRELSRTLFFTKTVVLTFLMTIGYTFLLRFIEFHYAVKCMYVYLALHSAIFVGLFFKVDQFILGNMYAAMTFFGFTTISASSLGVSSPVIAWLVSTKVSASWFAGQKSGNFWTGMSLLAIFIMFVSEHAFDISYGLGYNPEYRSLFSGIIHMGVIVYYALTIFVYERWKVRAVEKTKALYKDKEELFNVVNHDLRGPLSAIKLHSHALKKLIGQEKEKEYGHAEKIGVISTKTVNILQRLLTLNALEEDHGSGLKAEEFELNELLLSSIEQMKVLSHRRNIVLKSHLEKIDVFHDKALIESILDNIISNAVKYSSNHSEVVIHLKKVENDSFEFSVKDSGQGMTKEDLKNLFGKYKKLSSTNQDEGQKSIGLGLSIVKKQVELLGGTATAHSRGKDMGTTFVLVIPCSINKISDIDSAA